MFVRWTSYERGWHYLNSLIATQVALTKWGLGFRQCCKWTLHYTDFFSILQVLKTSLELISRSWLGPNFVWLTLFTLDNLSTLCCQGGIIRDLERPCQPEKWQALWSLNHGDQRFIIVVGPFIHFTRRPARPRYWGLRVGCFWTISGACHACWGSAPRDTGIPAGWTCTPEGTPTERVCLKEETVPFR